MLDMQKSQSQNKFFPAGMLPAYTDHMLSTGPEGGLIASYISVLEEIAYIIPINILCLSLTNIYRQHDNEFAAIHGTLFRRGGKEARDMVWFMFCICSTHAECLLNIHSSLGSRIISR